MLSASISIHPTKPSFFVSMKRASSERVNKNETSGRKVYGVFSLLDAGGLIQTASGKEGCCGGRRTKRSG